MIPEYLIKKDFAEIEISQNLLQIHPNAVDLINISTSRSAVYENHCFSFLQRRAREDLVVGPHLVDYMFGKTPYVAGLVRPDSLLLTKQGNQVALTGMAEFKSGKGNGFTNKLDGFTVLLEKLRKQPHMLPEMIFYAIGEHVDTPESIVIPPDEEIEITFLAPFEEGVLYDASTSPFPVTYFRVPLLEQIAS